MVNATNGNKKVPLLCLMSFENAPVPLSIFKEDRTMIFAERKSDFVHKLEELVTEPKKISMSGVDAMILDGNDVIQALPPTAENLSRTFKQMAEAFLNYVQHKSVSFKHVHIVIDIYQPNNTKDATREKRGQHGHTYHTKNWQQFLSNG